MARIVVLDTSTIIALIGTKGADDVRRFTREHVVAALKEKSRFVVPTPVVAELHYGGALGSEEVERLIKALGAGARIVGVNRAAANAAGQMRADAIARHRKEHADVRGAVIYDALIAGVAVQQNAAAIFTANRRDFESQLRVIDSKIDVVDTSRPPKGQAELFEGEGPTGKPKRPPKKR